MRKLFHDSFGDPGDELPPHTPEAPPAHPNCRCYLDPRTFGRAVNRRPRVVIGRDYLVDLLDMPPADRAVLIEVLEGMSYRYRFAWKNNPARAKLFGRRCRIVRTGKLGSVLLEFDNGERVVSSRRALRRAGP